MMMMMMIDSPGLESDSDKRLCFSIPQNDLLKSPITEKLDDINNNNPYQQDQTSIDCNNTIKQNNLSLNDNNENNTTLLTTTTTTTVEFKVKTTKTSSRKRKLNVINDINNDNINKQQAITKKKKKQRGTKVDDHDDDKKKKKTNSKTIDQSSVTDESSFGSCEPGTSVVLQGIVWNETDKGVLVVNITWRGKTYVGALLNTTEQNWAPPRYKSDIRSIKQNPIRDHQLTSIPSSHEPTERILRNGKRRGSSTTVTPSSTAKTKSFKIPETPLPSKSDEISTTNEKFVLPSSTNMNDDDETGDNYSSRSVSPTTSGISTTSSSPPLSNNNENQSTSIPIDLSNSKTTMNIEQNLSNSMNQQSSISKETLIPYHFTNDILFPSSTNPSDYFSSLHGSTNSFNLPSFNKLSSTSSTIPSSSYLPISSQLYFNSLTTPHYPSVSSLSKSSH